MRDSVASHPPDQPGGGWPAAYSSRPGFSLFEIVVVCSVIALIAVAGMPRFRQALVKERMRAAVSAVSTHAAVARETAIARGCLTTLHFTAGTGGTAWITSCKTVGSGLDTVGAIDPIASRFRVSMAVTVDSVRFTPFGLRADYQTTQVSITMAGNPQVGTVSINQLGRATVSQ